MSNKLNSNPKLKKRQKNRSHVGQLLLLLCMGVFLCIGLRFSYISVFKHVQGVNLSQLAHNLYTQNKVIPSKRGTIYDANGQPLAEDTSKYTLYAVLNKNYLDINHKPMYVTNKKKVARAISDVLPISYKQALKNLSPKNNAFQVEFGSAGSNISLITRKKLENKHVSGLGFTQQPSRIYPNGEFASHIIGYASPLNTKNGSSQLVGQMGIEQIYNKLLTGTDGYSEEQKDSTGVEIPNKNNKSKKVKNGDDVYTTLDYRLQSLLETEMTNVYNQAHPSTMNAVLANAKTGDILAATQRPTFNATTKQGLDKIWRNTLVQDSYEPGSTMKIFTVASSINSGHYNGNATYTSGQYFIDGRVVPDWNPAGWGTISYNKGFALSSNVAMAHLEQNMGPKTWRQYMNRFQFFKPSNTGFSGEENGSVQFQYPIEQANTAFGQGIQVNALQMVRALTSIANDGKMLQPRFVSKIVNPKNKKLIQELPPKIVGNPITSETSKKVIKHMEDVVYQPYGIGADYKIPGYKIAAKTGTAQVSDGKSGYASGDDSYLYSVAGIAPANNPKYILYLTMKQPKLPAGKTASQLMAQIFNPVMRLALEENVNANNSNDVEVPKIVNDSIDDAKNKMKKSKVKYIVIGNGNKVMDQSIDPYEKVTKDRLVILQTDGDKKLANFKGWSRYDVATYCRMAGISVDLQGDGYAYQQSILPNSPIYDMSKLSVKFK
ncbi:penicillin-binding protein [Apilactobacillus apisilvae]|uniref:Penicillin-binding protein n=1 Tax=Apilactobacillus apisilvae TaxID=2923364 RepID=A0ABY4PI67_9LACO|nr:penicillin-binding transpeptidase domain-containing protein [Apilactobacillus apisilvae]UQS85550.1 penicillin-binding protein [Apilactobacillus apisilvae]